MKKLLAITVTICLTILTFTSAVTADNYVQVDGWAYLGVSDCDEHKYPIYKKAGSENEFMMLLSTGERNYFKMKNHNYFKMCERGKIWECELGGRNDLPDRYYCHKVINGVDRFRKCIDENTDTTDNYAFKAYTDMCKRNWGKTLNRCMGEALQFAYKSRTHQPPNWDDLSQQAQQIDKFRKEETLKVEQKSTKKSSTKDYPSSKMQILKHKSGGCTLVITNQTVYDFDIKINGVNHGVLPARKIAVISDLNCNGFMAEAWPKGSVTGSVHKAFQHHQKNGKKFSWTLKYNR